MEGRLRSEVSSGHNIENTHKNWFSISRWQTWLDLKYRLGKDRMKRSEVILDQHTVPGHIVKMVY